MSFESTTNISEQELEAIVADEIARRKISPGGAATTVAGAGTAAGKTAIHVNLINDLLGEFEDIRNDPARAAKQMDQMVRVYDKYLDQGNNPVEIFIDRPGENIWAAGQTKAGDDVVFYDSTAPHPAVMAHELGHVQMNHSNDPLSVLQHSGIGKLSGALAIPLGAGGALLGRRAMPKHRIAGTALGGLLGTVGASGNFAYELGGASGRALGYLPEDVDQTDAAGDLLRAGLTYGMGGPGTALAAAITAAGVDRVLNNRIRP